MIEPFQPLPPAPAPPLPPATTQTLCMCFARFSCVALCPPGAPEPSEAEAKRAYCIRRSARMSARCGMISGESASQEAAIEVRDKAKYGYRQGCIDFFVCILGYARACCACSLFPPFPHTSMYACRSPVLFRPFVVEADQEEGLGQGDHQVQANQLACRLMDRRPVRQRACLL